MISLWVVSHLANAMLGFWFAIGLIELLLWGWRLRYRRLRYFVRLIPLAKLPFDLWRSSGDWVGWHGLDPALAEEGSRVISAATGISLPFPLLKVGMTLENGYPFSWVDLLASRIPNMVVGGIAAALASIALVRLVRVAIQLRPMGGSYQIPIGRNLWLSPTLARPCTTMRGRVLLPLGSLALPLDELCAIIAHERDHAKWRDGYFYLATQVIGALFWCIPGLAWWCRKIEFERECACDRAAKRGESMARAIAKVAGWQGERHALGLVRSTGAVPRIEALLEREPKRWHWLLALGAVYSAGVVLWGEFWIL